MPKGRWLSPKAKAGGIPFFKDFFVYNYSLRENLKRADNIHPYFGFFSKRRLPFLNILIIDDLLLPESAKADSSEKALFCRAAEENLKRRIWAAKEFQKLGANVLLIRAKLLKTEAPLSFEFSESEGLSQLFVKIPAKQRGNFLRLPELFSFGTSLLENAPGLSGIFEPDIVLSGGILPFSFLAGEKISEGSNAVFVTELSCLPAETLKHFGFAFGLNPVLRYFKKSTAGAFLKSHAVLGFFPEAAKNFSGAHNLYPMVFPSFPEAENPSEKEVFLKEKLSSFGEGKTFVLAFCGEIEEGFSIEELILSAGTFGDKFALVFISEGRKKPYFKRFVAERGITNVFFPEDFSKEETPFILSGADGIFVSESDFGKGIFPEEGSFWKALGAQKPVIAAAEHWSDFFRKAGGAIITKPRRRDSITLGIKTLINMSETDRETLGRANREFFEKNSAENFAKETFLLFDNFVKQKEIKK